MCFILYFLIGEKGLLQTSQKRTMLRITQSSDTDLGVFCLRPPINQMHKHVLGLVPGQYQLVAGKTKGWVNISSARWSVCPKKQKS